jgi:GntR family transcriptional regulator
VDFYLDRSSGTPTYLQLVQQVRQALRVGALVPGDQLPTAAEVVERLGINPNTVLKAYRELEREGLVAPRPGQGTFVRQGLGSAPAVAYTALRRELVKAVRAARAAGLDGDDIQAVFASVLHESTERGVA